MNNNKNRNTQSAGQEKHYGHGLQSIWGYDSEGQGSTNKLGGEAQPLTEPLQHCQVNKHIVDSLDLKLLATDFSKRSDIMQKGTVS